MSQQLREFFSILGSTFAFVAIFLLSISLLVAGVILLYACLKYGASYYMSLLR